MKSRIFQNRLVILFSALYIKLVSEQISFTSLFHARRIRKSADIDILVYKAKKKKNLSSLSLKKVILSIFSE